MSGEDREYEKLSVQALMLSDLSRCDAYVRALRQTVRPGDVVLDAGAGTGFLAIVAAKMGASKVYAVERTGMARFAEQLVVKNGVSDRVEVLCADISCAEPPEKVDVIVSEWLGGAGCNEIDMALLAKARDRWLKGDGKMIPRIVHTYCALTDYDEVADSTLMFRRPGPVWYDVDLSPVAEGLSQIPKKATIRTRDLLTVPQLLCSNDILTMSAAGDGCYVEGQANLTAFRRGRLTGVTCWFVADLAPAVSVENSPETVTHWDQLVFRIGGVPLDVDVGSELVFRLSCRPGGNGWMHYEWSVVGCGMDLQRDSRRATYWSD